MSPVSLFRGVRPIRRQEVLNDVLAGITLAALGIPEVMGYTKIAETPVVTGLYTLLLPVVAFAVLGASRISGFGDCSDPRGDARDGRRAPVSGVRGAESTRLSGLLARPIEAAIEAAHVRFRPIIMTALAMVLGMLPMALALGEGSEMNAPLGRAVIGGLLAATLMTLFVVPAVYSIFSRKLIGKHERDARIAAVALPGA